MLPRFREWMSHANSTSKRTVAFSNFGRNRPVGAGAVHGVKHWVRCDGDAQMFTVSSRPRVLTCQDLFDDSDKQKVAYLTDANLCFILKHIDIFTGYFCESPFLCQKWQLTLPARRNQLRAYFALSNDWQHHCLHWCYISGTSSENPTSNMGCLMVSATVGLFLFSLLCWSLWRNHELYVVYLNKVVV